MRRAGARTVTLRGLAAGSYRVEVRARDLGGNRSRVKHAQRHRALSSTGGAAG